MIYFDLRAVEMGSPPTPDAALKVSSFTPSHHLKDRLLSFTDFLLSNIEEWSNPHPIWPSPPPPVSFSGSERFIKGRLPHRTLAISASLASMFSDPGTCKHAKEHAHVQDENASNILGVKHSGDDDTRASHILGDDGRTAAENTHSETPELNILRFQVDAYVQGSHSNNPQDTVEVSEIRLHDYEDRTHLQNADSLQIPPSCGTLGALDGSSEILLTTGNQSVSVPGVVAAERLSNAQPNSVNHSFFAMGVVDRGLQGEAPGNPPMTDVDDLEEGELSEIFLDDNQPTCMEEGNGKGEATIQKCSTESSRLETDMQRGSPNDPNGSKERVIDSESDKDMDEPIGSYVSRRRMQLLRILANRKVNGNAEPLKKRDYMEMSIEEEQDVLGSGSKEKPEQVKILEESLAGSAFATDVNNDDQFMGLQRGSSLVTAHGMCIDNAKIDGAIPTFSKGLVQQGYAEVGEPEEGVKKKKKRSPLAEAKRKNTQKAKHKARERKSGVCKLKFKPFIDKTQTTKKTCSYYVKGKCGKGASCRFSHDVTPLTKSEVCKYFIMNCCLKGNDCPFSHTLSSFPCKNFHVRGRCMEGESCQFSHKPMSEEEKKEFLLKIEEEQRARQSFSNGMGGVVGTPSDKSYSSNANVHVKGKEAVADYMLTKPKGVDEYSKLAAAKMAASTSLSARDGESHIKSGPATGMESGGKLGFPVMSSSGGIATTQERRSKADAFLCSQLEESRFFRGSKHDAGLENVVGVSGTLSKQSLALSMGQATPIRVSSMSALRKLDAKPLDLGDSGFLSERVLREGLVQHCAPVSDSPPTLLDLLLRPHERTLPKDLASSDASIACTNTSNVFLNRFLK